MPLLAPLTPDQQATFLVVSVPEPALRKLVGRLGTAPPGTRLDAVSVWELADSLVDYYAEDAEVATAVDKMLRKTLGPSPLAPALEAAGGAQAVTALLLESRDPAREVAWALLSAATENAGPLAATLVQTIIAEYDQADTSAREQAEHEPEQAAPAPEQDDAARRAADLEREAARARGQHARAVKRAATIKERVVELERTVADARRAARIAEEQRDTIASERDRLRDEKDELRTRLKAGTAAEVMRLGEELEAARRRERALAEDLDEARGEVSTLATRLRAVEQTARPRPAGDAAENAPVASEGATWHLPVFTAEYYDSLRGWDRRIVRSAFEKAHRLAEDWRHPSLRAIPLEGLPEYYRLRVATDVRLIYRLGEGGRVELLSLIDREDLPRYIRNVRNA